MKEIQVKVVPVAEGQVGSVATVNFTAEIASRTTIASPKLSVKLTAAPQVRVNETVTLNFVISNNGSVDAHRVVLRNMIPENLKLPDVSERDLEYDLGTLPAGKSQTVQLQLTAVRPGKVVNRAVITTDGRICRRAASRDQRHRPDRRPVATRSNQLVRRPSSRVRESHHEPLAEPDQQHGDRRIAVEHRRVRLGLRRWPLRREATYRDVACPASRSEPNAALKIKVTPKAIGNHAGSVQISENNRKGASTDYQFRDRYLRPQDRVRREGRGVFER